MESRLTIRLFVEEVDLLKVAAFAQILRERLAPTVDVIQSETKAYWKIPEWSEVFLGAQPFAETKPPSAFHSVLAALGEGWQRILGEVRESTSGRCMPMGGVDPKTGLLLLSPISPLGERRTLPLPQQEHRLKVERMTVVCEVSYSVLFFYPAIFAACRWKSPPWQGNSILACNPSPGGRR
jgi:hypothetical protein